MHSKDVFKSAMTNSAMANDRFGHSSFMGDDETRKSAHSKRPNFKSEFLNFFWSWGEFLSKICILTMFREQFSCRESHYFSL